DTIYSLLNSTDATPENAASSETSGRIVSNTTIVLDTTITRLNAAWIPIVDGPEFFVPNAFSPSGVYEENRVFRPFFVGAEITSISIAVFNNYNDQIYTYSESGNDLELESVGWDGRLQGGQDAEAGVYYYRIQLVADGQVYSKTSSVLLTK
ncbi:MAG: gliding motility-associated C-terminal domain-containing protein, partial [Ekhidna sp.]|nr:gliding motility-associated C-terminal domain-containing protein [Ekhidna sp.]